MEFPEPVISVAIEPKTKADQKKWVSHWAVWHRKIHHSAYQVMKRLTRLSSPVWVNYTDVLVDRMRREFKVEANVGKPQVAYREAITMKVTDIEGKHAKQSGGRGQYGHVVIDMYPLNKKDAEGVNMEYEFVNEIKGGVIPGEYIPAVDKGIRSS